jgi:hypothetical protein
MKTTPFMDRPARRKAYVTLECALCSRRLRSWRGPGPHFCTRCLEDRLDEVNAIRAEHGLKPLSKGRPKKEGS